MMWTYFGSVSFKALSCPTVTASLCCSVPTNRLNHWSGDNMVSCPAGLQWTDWDVPSVSCSDLSVKSEWTKMQDTNLIDIWKYNIGEIIFDVDFITCFKYLSDTHLSSDCYGAAEDKYNSKDLNTQHTLYI